MNNIMNVMMKGAIYRDDGFIAVAVQFGDSVQSRGFMVVVPGR